MPQQMTLDQLSEMRGAPVHDATGEKIGSVEEIFYDEQTRQPEWIGLGTGLFGTKRALVPVQGADISDDRIMVPYSKERVKNSPGVDSDEISQETEQELYSCYGLQYSERRSETGLPEGQAGYTGGRAGPEDEATLTRAEEELRVGKQPVEAGHARLRKWVETEPVEMDVELQQETARLKREPIDQPVGEGGFGEEEVEVGLRRERPVVEKQAVAKERVSIEKDVDTEQQRVSDELRKERVDVEGDDVRER
jgi:uncharacterized protein (TIGR02271 family)